MPFGTISNLKSGGCSMKIKYVLAILAIFLALGCDNYYRALEAYTFQEVLTVRVPPTAKHRVTYVRMLNPQGEEEIIPILSFKNQEKMFSNLQKGDRIIFGLIWNSFDERYRVFYITKLSNGKTFYPEEK